MWWSNQVVPTVSCNLVGKMPSQKLYQDYYPLCTELSIYMEGHFGVSFHEWQLMLMASIDV